MGGNIFGEHSDLIPPCDHCGRKHMGCRDTCDDPQFLEAMRLRKLRDEDRKKRMAGISYEVMSAERRRRRRNG